MPIVQSLIFVSEHFREDTLAVCRHAFSSTYLFSGGQFCKQTDGVTMGSPFSPVIANFERWGWGRQFDRNVGKKLPLLAA
jgi:hypothetical protein